MKRKDQNLSIYPSKKLKIDSDDIEDDSFSVPKIIFDDTSDLSNIDEMYDEIDISLLKRKIIHTDFYNGMLIMKLFIPINTNLLTSF